MVAPVIALALIAGAFVVGAIPFGVLLARRHGIDIREHGSGNIGATNVTRVLGPRVGFAVLVLDAAKGALVVVAAMRLCGQPWVMAGTGFAAVLGHCFSPFLGWKGGKGVATGFGVFVVLVPELAALAVLVFVAAWRMTRVPAIGSLAGVVAMAAILIARGDTPYAMLACATCALLFFTHRSNLAKLL